LYGGGGFCGLEEGAGGSGDDDGAFTMVMMLKSMKIDFGLVGWDEEMER